MLSFLFFTDMGIYWIHRGLHHKLLYKVRDGMVGSRRRPSPCAEAAAEPLLPGNTCPGGNEGLSLAEQGLASVHGVTGAESPLGPALGTHASPALFRRR